MSEPPEYQIDGSKLYRTTIETDKGTIVADLDPQLAPNTVNNFVGLARKGYYDGLTFHRVVPGFVIQGGCPEGTGTGGPGYKFRDEDVQGEYTLGAFAMANAGPNTNGSQFFITIDDCTRKLDEGLQPLRLRDRRHGCRAQHRRRRRDEDGDGRGSRPPVACRIGSAPPRSVGRGGVDQAVALADAALELPEDQRVDHDADDQDHDHRGVHAGVVGDFRRVVELAAE